jgi:chromate transporter
MDRHDVPWRVVVARFLRLGLLGFGGPSNHLAIMRRQWVESGDIEVQEFSDAFAAVSLLPGPASTQLAMWIGWRIKAWRGLATAATLFVVPAVALVLVLSTLLYGSHHVTDLEAVALGAAAIVPAIALRAGWDLTSGYRNTPRSRDQWTRLILYITAGVAITLLVPTWLPVALVGAGVAEVVVREGGRVHRVVAAGFGAAKGSLIVLALKVGALSFGGGFVIVPLMRGDAVTTHHWMTASAFSIAVALGQLTPGPVVATIAAVGYAAGGTFGGIVAAAVAFAPSLVFVGVGARRFSAVRSRPAWRAFFDGAAPAAAGAIAASALVLARGCPHHWQWPLIAVGVSLVVLLRRSTTWTLVAGGLVGLLLELTLHVTTA